MTNIVTNITKMKQCNRCEETKPATAEFFHSDKTHSDGLRSQCIICRRASDAKTRQAKRDKKAKLSLKSQASRHAILRLIKNHRSEFDAILKTELMVLTSKAEGEPKSVWINAG